MKTVTVDAESLRKILTALNGPSYFIREIQATRNLPGRKNPIDILTDEFNQAVVASNTETTPDVPTPQGPLG